MQVVAAYGQHVGTALQVNLSRFVVMPLHVADGAKIYDDRPMDLRELLRIELLEQFLERNPDHGLGGRPSITPGDERVLRVRPKIIDVVDRDEAYGLSR